MKLTGHGAMGRREPVECVGDSEAPSGVHPRLGRVLVIEPDASMRPRWHDVGRAHHVEFVRGPSTLPHALARPGEPLAVSLALTENTAAGPRATLVRALTTLGLHGRRIVDVRRCDLATAVDLIGRGYILCADDESLRGNAPKAVSSQTTMGDELAEEGARTRLAKTLGATEFGRSPSPERRRVASASGAYGL